MDSAKTYKALVVREGDDKRFSKAIEEVSMDFLPKGEVLIRVHYAALNYKDALSASGHKGITKSYPHTPGVDASGIVEESQSSDFKEGDKVIVTSYDLGMNTKGGFAEYISVPAHWVVPLPSGMSLLEAMVIGTAGFTAALALHKMELNGQKPSMGEILVSGASGGVGSLAVNLLHGAGYTVIASSGKSEYYPWLKKIGAKHCINREELIPQDDRPLMRSRWAGAIDTVGGETLSSILRACGRNGSVASCGLVRSPFFEISVYPFILNGVNLLGVDSAETPLSLRRHLWNELSGHWKPGNLEDMHKEVSLEEIPGYMNDILSGETVGRIIASLA